MPATANASIGEYRWEARNTGRGEIGCRCVAVDYPACFATGASVEEATAKVDEIVQRRQSVACRMGSSLPKPGTADEPPKQLKLRVARSMHRVLIQRAHAQNTSLNELTIQLLIRSIRRTFEELPTTGAIPLVCRGARRVRAPQGKPLVATPSGNWPQRLPPELHEQFRLLAAAEGVTLNLYVNTKLAEELALLPEIDSSSEKTSRAA